MCECVNHCNVLCLCDLIPVTPTTVKSIWWLLMAWHHIGARPFADIMLIIILLVQVSLYLAGLILGFSPANETSLQSNAISHWLSAKLESALIWWVSNQCPTGASWHNDPSKSGTHETLFLKIRFRSGAGFTSKVTDSKYCTNMTADECVLLVTGYHEEIMPWIYFPHFNILYKKLVHENK